MPRRSIVGEWAGGDDDAAWVEAEMVGLADDLVGGGEDLAQARVVDFFEHGVEVAAHAAGWIGMPTVGDEVEQDFELIVVELMGFGGFADGGFGPHGADGGDESRSMSGGSARSGLRKRSKSRLCSIGSTVVMPMQ